MRLWWKSSTGVDTGALGMNLGYYLHYGLFFILHLSPHVFYGSKTNFHEGEMALGLLTSKVLKGCDK